MKLFWQGCQLSVSDHFGGCQIANIRIKKKLLYSKTSNTSYLRNRSLLDKMRHFKEAKYLFTLQF